MTQDIIYYLEDAIRGIFAQSFVSLMISLLSYIFCSLSIYTIAQRRAINHPWMAWIPLLNLWTLGSISDQYQYVTKGRTTNRRIILVVAEIAVFLLGIVSAAMALSSLSGLLQQLAYGGSMDGVMNSLGATLIIVIPLAVLAVVGVVYEIMCLYDLFVSCDSKNGLLFFILSIVPYISTYCKPIFLFLCRHKDEGMPARKRRRSSSWDDEDSFGGSGRKDTWDDEF